MTHLIPTQAPRRLPGDGFWRKTWAMLLKEFIQLRRDRVSFAMIIMIPLVQLMLFGYAINTMPRDLPTAVLMQERNDLDPLDSGRAREHQIFQGHRGCRVPKPRSINCWPRARCCSRSKSRPISSVRCGAATSRRMLIEADATDPVASGTALGALGQVLQTALSHDRDVPDNTAMPFEIRTHARYNPAGVTQLNIVPGLVGTILTMTMLIFTALSVTREIERGTMESLLAMPITPVEIMLGKIVPYILVGFVQAALIIGIGVSLFGVPIVGNLGMLAALSTLFIATNLSIGYTFSTHCAEPAAGDADVDDVLPAEHSAVRLHVPVRRHAGLGAICRRGAAAHALSAHRALDHAERRLAWRSALRCASRCSC